jgi:MULE transposase domain
MANLEILVFDSTYRTNRYKIPLINIIDITPCNKSFFADSAFIFSERVLDFEYMFKTIKKIYNIAKLSYSTTFVTDGDPHVTTTMHRVFPEINYILCI